MKEVKTTRRLKKKLSQDLSDGIVIYRVYVTALQDLHKLSNVLLNVTQNDSL